MSTYLIMCRSLTYAQRAARALERANITATVAKVPQGVVTEGCTYCVRVTERRLRDALDILRKAGLPTGKVYYASANGDLREAAV